MALNDKVSLKRDTLRVLPIKVCLHGRWFDNAMLRGIPSPTMEHTSLRRSSHVKDHRITVTPSEPRIRESTLLSGPDLKTHGRTRKR